MCGPSQLPQQQCRRTFEARNAFDRAVDRLDVSFHRALEDSVAVVLVKARALDSEVRAVELQSKTAVGDGAILLAQLSGEREQVVLLRVVVRVEHRRGDDAG